MNILIVGDIVGRPGRRALMELLPGIVEGHDIGFVIANGENAAGGAGITRETAKPLLAAGVDVLTMGNHVWNHRESYSYIEEEVRIVRPANYPPGVPGRGASVFEAANGARIGVINLLGRTFMQALDDPFRVADETLERIEGESDLVFVDIHAEATSEKMALSWYLDGRVACSFGTHTHVQTADERLLPKNTAYISDVGMTGPRDSIIGMRPEEIINRFRTGLPSRFEVAGGPVMLCGVVVACDENRGIATNIERIRMELS